MDRGIFGSGHRRVGAVCRLHSSLESSQGRKRSGRIADYNQGCRTSHTRSEAVKLHHTREYVRLKLDLVGGFDSRAEIQPLIIDFKQLMAETIHREESKLL
mmetsp:Transcript_399/g.917  ORF Transcript_399/g.917 Transcript_399/m.917 type:complete len:101 (-) Transcript_399:242-544(-)